MFNPKTIEHMRKYGNSIVPEEILPFSSGTMGGLAVEFCRELLEFNFENIEPEEAKRLANKITGLYALHISNITATQEISSIHLHAFTSLVLYIRYELIGNQDLFTV